MYYTSAAENGTCSQWNRGSHPHWDTAPTGWKVHKQLPPQAQALLKCLLEAKQALGPRSIDVHFAKVCCGGCCEAVTSVHAQVHALDAGHAEQQITRSALQ